MKKRQINSAHELSTGILFRSVNAVWKAFYPIFGRPKLEKDELIKTARKATGYHNLGPWFHEEALDKMLYSLNEEAKLNPMGRYISRQRILSLLKTRLRAEHWFKILPEILEQELYPMVVIVGLQRTGTTKLQRMLSADPNNRALLSWEAINPVPLTKDIHEQAKRIKIAHTSEKALRFMAPDFFAIHPVEHLAPEEDVLLLDASFLSTTIEATAHVPSYAAWLEVTDQSAAYAYAARLMKFLQWQRPAKRWVLKTPHHLEFMPLVDRYFGYNTRYIWTHRRIEESVPSFLSMVAQSRMIFSSHVDKEEVGRHWIRKTGYMLDKALAYRKSGDHEKKFTDIWYYDFVKEALPGMEKIYRDAGLAFGAEQESIFFNAEKANPKGKYGHHQYHIEDFGFTANDLDRATTDYRLWQREVLLNTKENVSFESKR